ncbi:MAG: hypothetical protein WCL44_15795 [bacterium]
MNAKFTPKLFLATLVASIIIPQIPVSAIATRREPPPEAFAACVGKSEVTTVELVVLPFKETIFSQRLCNQSDIHFSEHDRR